MCFFGSGSKPKEVAPPPLPPPTPIPSPAEVSPLAEDEARRKRLDRQRAGFAATLKTGPRGVTGSGANLSSANATGKAKLG